MDKLTITGLQVFSNHGVEKEERTLGQKFLVSCTMHLDTRNAAKNDDLNETIDYGKVCFRITRFFTEHTYQLIETAAEELSKELLHTIPLLRGLDLEIEKPWAPIGLPLQTVSVAISRCWHQAYIALGSNMGDKEAYMRHGVDAIEQSKNCRMLAVSEFIETKPYGVTQQPNFLNGCIKMETLYSPDELLDFLHEIEHSVNRVREGKWGPRTLDLDIIFYDDAIIDTEELRVPHMDMHNRDFVLYPLCQLAPNYSHPVLHKTVHILLEELEKNKKVMNLV